jgi:GNAT superfamily N-acetyltransferase
VFNFFGVERSLDSVTDGASRTIMLAERLAGNGDFGPWDGWWCEFGVQYSHFRPPNWPGSDRYGGNATVVVAESGSGILGFAVSYAAADEAESANVAVATFARRGGIGRTLVGHVVARHGDHLGADLAGQVFGRDFSVAVHQHHQWLGVVVLQDQGFDHHKRIDAQQGGTVMRAAVRHVGISVLSEDHAVGPEQGCCRRFRDTNLFLHGYY